MDSDLYKRKAGSKGKVVMGSSRGGGGASNRGSIDDYEMALDYFDYRARIGKYGNRCDAW